MDYTFNQNELSAEDLAVLRAFDALDMEDWKAEQPDTSTLHPTQHLADRAATNSGSFSGERTEHVLIRRDGSY